MGYRDPPGQKTFLILFPPNFSSRKPRFLSRASAKVARILILTNKMLGQIRRRWTGIGISGFPWRSGRFRRGMACSGRLENGALKAAPPAWSPIDPKDFLTAPTDCGTVVKERQKLRPGCGLVRGPVLRPHWPTATAKPIRQEGARLSATSLSHVWSDTLA
jgi:hypothetical protein